MRPPVPAPDPAPETARFLLREAIRASGMFDQDVARKVFGVSPAALSDWLSGNNRPRPESRAAIEAWARVPLSAWETPDERAQRERAASLRSAPSVAAPPALQPPPKARRKPPAKSRKPPAKTRKASGRRASVDAATAAPLAKTG